MSASPAASGPILGLSGDYHDAAAAVVVDGRIVCAAQEERFTRRKHDPSLPIEAMAWCLEEAGIGPHDLAAVAFHGKPFTIYERVLRTHARVGPRAFPTFARAVRSWTGRKLWAGYRIERALERLGRRSPVLAFAEHHAAHGASAFFPSPFDSAAVLTFDGVGEWATTTVARGRGHELEPLLEIQYPDSLGLLYSAVTAHCGFSVNDGESKLMGLAPYGEPRYEQVLRDRVVELRGDGSFRLDLRWFDFDAGARMSRPRLSELFDGPARRPDEPLTQREADLACSVQRILDDAIVGVARRAHDLTGERDACLAGGVALNCVANGRLLERGPFDRIWVQPAAGDAGGAPGAALWYHHIVAGAPRPEPADLDGMAGCALGPSYDDDEVAAWLDKIGVAHVRHPDIEACARAAAADLDRGLVLGWFQGAMEFGPRALGNRSILADPRLATSVTRINLAVKGREGFRPLAPAVLAEHRADLFHGDAPSPYMLTTARVRGARIRPPAPVTDGVAGMARQLAAVDSPIPACTHVDGSARLQTVDRDRFPVFHQLLTAFHRLSGCPALVNTSFNRADEPIVRTPAEALSCAVRSGLDGLVLGRLAVSGAELARLAGARTEPALVGTGPRTP